MQLRTAKRVLWAIRIVSVVGLLTLFGVYAVQAVKDYTAGKDTPVTSLQLDVRDSLTFPQITVCASGQNSPNFTISFVWLVVGETNTTDVTQQTGASEPQLSQSFGYYCVSVNKRGAVAAIAAGFSNRLWIQLAISQAPQLVPYFSSLRVDIAEPGTSLTPERMQSASLFVSPGTSSVSLTKSTLTLLDGTKQAGYTTTVSPIAITEPKLCSTLPAQLQALCNNGSTTTVSILLSYSDLIVRNSVQSPASTVSSLLGNLSGMLGLLVGFSFMTVIDLVGFILKRFCVAGDGEAAEGARDHKPDKQPGAYPAEPGAEEEEELTRFDSVVASKTVANLSEEHSVTHHE